MLKQLVNSFKKDRLQKQHPAHKTTESILSWNKICFKIRPRLVNAPPASRSFADSDMQAVKDCFDMQVGANITVADVKALVEERIRRDLKDTTKASVDLIELRLGDTLTLPPSAKLSQFIQNSKQIGLSSH